MDREDISSASDDAKVVELSGPTAPLPTRPGAGDVRERLPVRYAVRDDEEGPYLVCTEASNIAVQVRRGLSISASAARRATEGTIFLDGVAQGEPFMDVEHRLYNLDHHEGCVRAFTLAACEQAMVLLLKGLDLATDRWTVMANEPDLDTVLAIWLLLNHRRVQADGSRVRERLHPVVRLQGVIDAHGLELQELAALPEPLRSESLATINALRERELELKRTGDWQSVDALEYVVEVLRTLDDFAYSARDFDDVCRVEELERVSVGPDRFAIVCRSEGGIYEVEQQLLRSHGDRVGLIVLQKDSNTYTLRQVDSFLRRDLDALYARLNLVDPRVRGDERWGGSSEIGGSPRSSGTGLDPRRLAAVIRWVYRPPSAARQAGAVAVAVGATAAILAACLLVAGGGLPLRAPDLLGAMSAGRAALFSVLAGVAGVITLVVVGRRQPGCFGLRRPRGRAWLAAVPVALLAGLAGAAWVPVRPGLAAGPLGTWLGVAVAGAVASEMLLRGVLQGSLVQRFAVIRSRGRLFASVPLVTSALMSTVVTVVLFAPPPGLPLGPPWLMGVTPWTAAVLAFGGVLAFSRERAESVVAPLLLHGLAAAAVVLLAAFGA